MSSPVTIYTDGACQPNPGPGGWAAIILRPGAEPQELSGAEAYTSNNQMELRAVIEGLRSLPESHQVQLYTDSKYLKQGITEWLPRWVRQGWRTSAKKPVKNQPLWQKLAAEVERHQIEWHWVKGHAGDRWNERADTLASAMIPAAVLPLDDESALHIFTAASYLGKQRRGGWGVLLSYRDNSKELNGSQTNTSANRMHLLAAIKGLQAVKRKLPIHIYTSSSYLHDGITRWVTAWQRRNWQTKSGQPVSHRDLWEALLAAMADYPVHWHLVSEPVPEAMKRTKTLASQAARGETEEV